MLMLTGSPLAKAVSRKGAKNTKLASNVKTAKSDGWRRHFSSGLRRPARSLSEFPLDSLQKVCRGRLQLLQVSLNNLPNPLHIDAQVIMHEEISECRNAVPFDLGVLRLHNR